MKAGFFVISITPAQLNLLVILRFCFFKNCLKFVASMAIPDQLFGNALHMEDEI